MDSAIRYGGEEGASQSCRGHHGGNGRDEMEVAARVGRGSSPQEGARVLMVDQGSSVLTD